MGSLFQLLLMKCTILLLVLFAYAVCGVQVTFKNSMSQAIYVTFTGDASWGDSCGPPWQPGTTCVAKWATWDLAASAELPTETLQTATTRKISTSPWSKPT